MSILSNKKVDFTSEYISTIATKVLNKEYDLNPIYQRKFIWTDQDRQDFLDAIFKDMIPTNIIFVVDSKEGNTINLDGKQRCKTLKMFFNNEIGYKVDNNTIIYNSKIPSNNNNNVRVLTSQEKVQIENRKIFVAKYFDLDYTEQIELFKNLNKGRVLTDGEKIKIDFNTKTRANKFSNLFESLENDFKDIVDTNRQKHNVLILRMLYNFDKNTKPAYNRKTIKKYFNDLTDRQINMLIKKFRPRISFIVNNIIWSSINKKNKEVYIENILVYLVQNYSKIKNHNKINLTKIVKRFIEKLNKEEDISENKTAKNYKNIYNFFDNVSINLFKIKGK